VISEQEVCFCFLLKDFELITTSNSLQDCWSSKIEQSCIGNNIQMGLYFLSNYYYFFIKCGITDNIEQLNAMV